MNGKPSNDHKLVKYSSEGQMLDGGTMVGEMTCIAVCSNGLVRVPFTNGLIHPFAV
jgi:hypothetical protein